LRLPKEDLNTAHHTIHARVEHALAPMKKTEDPAITAAHTLHDTALGITRLHDPAG